MPSEPGPVETTLRQGRALLARPYGWTKGSFRKWSNRGNTVCYCALGVVRHLTAIDDDYGKRPMLVDPLRLYGDVSRMLETNIPRGFKSRYLPHYNDAKTTTKADILALYDTAIKRAHREGI